ncbi:MFS transporter [Priestia koreensis]|uniref:MFS transporter n=1 Tax=Priestia koreensis TaxID=284581 RepID=UPI001F5646CB|nr:MFS transporter [Priestia koreensis]UNL86781.1 MFS transporter [Priestia koreensis]
MKILSRSFKALWIGEIVSEFGGAAGGIINSLLLYELTESKEWMGALLLIYFIPSLVLQSISAPFLNDVAKEKVLPFIQLIRSFAYLIPFIIHFIGTDTGAILGLIVLQYLLGMVQPIYASLSFSLLPDICKENELIQANVLLDGTIRLMSFIAPGATSLLLLVSPLHVVYVMSSALFFLSFLSLTHLAPTKRLEKKIWTKKLWWSEMRTGYKLFFCYPTLFRLTFLSSLVQFAVGTTMVISVPFIRGELRGECWEYAVFSASFPIGYVIGIFLLTRLPKNAVTMYIGLIGGGLSFILLLFVHSVPLAWLCELVGGMLFPWFNAQSAAIFQREAPRDRLSQLSSVRLLLLRITMPMGILFASSTFLDLSVRHLYAAIGAVIVLPGIYYLCTSLFPFTSINASGKASTKD